MTVYFNHPHYSIILPREVLESIGSPDYVKMLWNQDQHRILFRGHLPSEPSIPTAELETDWYDVPEHLYTSSCTALVFPQTVMVDAAAEALSWDDYVYAVECRGVKDEDENVFVLCDMKTAVASDSIHGPFVVPECLREDEDWDDEEEEAEE